MEEKREEQVNRYLAIDRKGGRKPCLFVKASTIPEAWEDALFAVWENGVSIETDYDVEKAGEPPSKEAAVLVEVTHPLKEPRIHKKGMVEGLDGLQKYVMEVCDGIHNHWVKIKKDDGTSIWDYSYHERLFALPIYDEQGNLLKKINQIEDLMQKLEKEKHITKSAQAITWLPESDHHAGHSPCLQRIVLRLIPSKTEGGNVKQYSLNLDTTWRSRDLKNAWFENVYGFTELQKRFAVELTQRLGIETIVGSYIDFSDSLHIYGRDFNPNVFLPSKGKTKFEDFLDYLESMRNSSWEEKTYRSDNHDVSQMMREEEISLLADPDYTRKGGLIARPKILYGKDGKDRTIAYGAEINGKEMLYKEGRLYYTSGEEYKPELKLDY